ncbi:DUF2892 domain-containing protein [Halorussus gelatinilyticus]|uniref:DUF2892 domain-containing protein n=1 Tax=Halorussus gelatinilyticus TaxID=2937524 RepID=A0A8U0IFB6_9EURY|nr:DUF2892 domain-containing protein [Halorussus gelatinilyticus]UPV99756.1 DUF2892 domain-containing protein [Halorussus gelatinilyticus]
MALPKNVGGRDRIARAVLGVASLALAGGAVLLGYGGIGVLALVAGAGFLFNAATRFCGVNALLGIDTCSRR